MFTGIIEEVGTIVAVSHATRSSRLTVKAPLIAADVKHGDSVATQGVCLTVDKIAQPTFTLDIMAQTLAHSTLKKLEVGNKVNLERALTLNTRLGGHIVSGHVDCTATIVSIDQDDIAKCIKIILPYQYTKYIIPKGSICIDGVSLTVASQQDNTFTVSIIPVTQQDTTLLTRKVGDMLNIELDILAKYTERLLHFKENTTHNNKLNTDFLKEHGFM